MAGPTTAERGDQHGVSEPGSRAPERDPRRGWRLPRRRTLVVALVLALPLGGFGAWALYGSDWLRVESVSVHWRGGPQKLTEAQVLDAARVPVGAPMAALDKGEVRDRLLDELPRLDSVEVVRGWPHGVTVKVTERRAEAQQVTADGYAEVDADGVVFAEVPRPLPGVPVLELDLTEGPSLARFGEERVRQSAVAVAAALPDPVRREARTVRAESYDSITVELSDGRTVRWGSAEDVPEKAEALRTLLKAAPDAEHFDVSVPSAPAAATG